MLKNILNIFSVMKNRQVSRDMGKHLNDHMLRDMGLLDSQYPAIGTNPQFDIENQIKQPPF